MARRSTAAENATPTVSLLVSNQSLELPSVDIEITIDGRSVVRDTFSVGRPELPQHEWKELQLRLARGSHRIVAESRKGAARLEAAFKLPGVRSLTVAFWTEPAGASHASTGKFTIDSSTRRGATM